MKKIVFSASAVLFLLIFAMGCGGKATETTDETATDSTETMVADTLNFGPLNKLSLNDASAEDFARIPGVGRRMVREFMEYRPYVSIEQFRREMGKYVDADAIAGYEKYTYVPVNINESDIATLTQIPGVTPEMAQMYIDARPYASNAAFLDKVIEISGGISQQFARHYIVQE